MAKKTVCSVPLDWTLEDYSRHTCFDGSHHHLSFAQAIEHEKRDLVIWLRGDPRKSEQTTKRRELSIVQIERLPERDVAWAGRPAASRVAGEPMNTGLSFRVGELLARRVRQRESWALVMLSHIRMRPTESANSI